MMLAFVVMAGLVSALLRGSFLGRCRLIYLSPMDGLGVLCGL